MIAARPNIAALVREVGEELKSQGSVTPRELAEAVVAEHGEAVADWREKLASAQLINLCQRYLAHPPANGQGVLAGIGDTKQTFTRQEPDGGFRYVPFAFATLADVDADLTVSETNLQAVAAEHRAKQERRDIYWSVTGACPEMALKAAVALLSDTA